jgi:hypothetical protein
MFIEVNALYSGKLQEASLNVDQITHFWSVAPSRPDDGNYYAEVHLTNGAKLTVWLADQNSTGGELQSALDRLAGRSSDSTEG